MICHNEMHNDNQSEWYSFNLSTCIWDFDQKLLEKNCNSSEEFANFP